MNPTPALLLLGVSVATHLSGPEVRSNADSRTEIRYLARYTEIYREPSGGSFLCSLAENPFGFVAQATDMELNVSGNGQYVAIPGVVVHSKNPNAGGVRMDPTFVRFFTEDQYDHALGVVDLQSGCKVVRLINLEDHPEYSVGNLVQTLFSGDGSMLFLDEHWQSRVYVGRDFQILAGTYPFAITSAWDLPGGYVATGRYWQQEGQGRAGWALLGRDGKLLGTVDAVRPAKLAQDVGSVGGRVRDGDVWVGGGQPVAADSRGIVFSYTTERRANGKVQSSLRQIAGATFKGVWTTPTEVPQEARSFELMRAESGALTVEFQVGQKKSRVELRPESIEQGKPSRPPS